MEGATRERLERIVGKDALIVDWLDAAPLDASSSPLPLQSNSSLVFADALIFQKADYPIAGVVQIQADRVRALFSFVNGLPFQSEGIAPIIHQARG